MTNLKTEVSNHPTERVPTFRRLFALAATAASLAGIFTSFACAHSVRKGGAVSSRNDYPAHWWQHYPESSRPAWEILPDEAGPGEVILSKRNELGVLSNFTETPFEFRGTPYRSVEGLWQMMLYPEDGRDERAVRAARAGLLWPHARESVASMVAFEAKSAGDAAERLLARLGIDWVTFEGRRFPYRSLEKGEHYRIIRAAMCEKLRQNRNVREILASTGNLVLRPDHRPEESSPPEWLYFNLWMEFRAELLAGREPVCEIK